MILISIVRLLCPVSTLGWRTRAQLLQMHGNNSALVDAIVDKKLAMGEFKDHPDCPDEESALLFYVMVSMDMINEDETEEKTTIGVDFNSDLGTEARICPFFAIAENDCLTPGPYIL